MKFFHWKIRIVDKITGNIEELIVDDTKLMKTIRINSEPNKRIIVEIL